MFDMKQQLNTKDVLLVASRLTEIKTVWFFLGVWRVCTDFGIILVVKPVWFSIHTYYVNESLISPLKYN